VLTLWRSGVAVLCCAEYEAELATVADQFHFDR
jgi:hypothetical protein